MLEQKGIVRIHAIANEDDKNMANGMRNTSGTPLDENEIAFVKAEIHRIKADESHRPHRKEYLSDWEQGKDYHTTQIWQDECRASLVAAQTAPGLTDIDRRDLVLDAVFRAHEFGQLIEMNDFMKEAVYGYSSNERKFAGIIEQPKYVSEASQEGIT